MRNRKITPFLVLIIVLLLSNCTKETTRNPDDIKSIDFDTLVFEPSMKGWELYSWPNGVDWNYSLLPGTNVLKDYEQVKYQNLVVSGSESLEMMFSKMPGGEEIIWMSEHWLEKIWIGNYQDLMLPPENLIQKVDGFCSDNDLILTIAY